LLGRNAAKRAQKNLRRPAALAYIKTSHSGITSSAQCFCLFRARRHRIPSLLLNVQEPEPELMLRPNV
jgi:hypothetical protein